MSARFLHDSVRFVQKRILWLFVRGFTFRTKIVRELCSVQYIDIQYITIILIIRSYGLHENSPFVFQGVLQRPS